MKQLIVEYARKNKPRLHDKENSNIFYRYTCKKINKKPLNTLNSEHRGHPVLHMQCICPCSIGHCCS